MARAMISPKFYAWDRNGKPLAFGKVYTYQARTNTPKPTYHSEDQIVPNTNPVILSGEGYADIYLDGSYKIVVKDSNDNEIWTADPVTQGGGDGSDTYSQFTLTGYYSTPTKVEVLGDYTRTMREGVRITLTTLQDSGRDKEQPSTIVSSVFDGDKTAITITDPLVTPGVKFVSVTNWPFEEIGAIEEFVESNELTFQTPQGQTKETITGIERKVFNQIASVPLGDGQWAAGKVYEAYNEYLNYGGIAYKPAMDTPLPYTTQGSDPTDGPDEGLVIPFSEVTRSDLVTVREDLINYGAQLYMGDDGESVKVGDTVPVGTTHLRVDVDGVSALVKMSESASGVVSNINGYSATVDGTDLSLLYMFSIFNTLEDLKNSKVNPEKSFVTGYHNKDDGAFGSNVFLFKPDSVKVGNDGTVVQSNVNPNGRYELQYSGPAYLRWFGARTTDTDVSGIILSSVDTVDYLVLDEPYNYENPLVISGDLRLVVNKKLQYAGTYNTNSPHIEVVGNVNIDYAEIDGGGDIGPIIQYSEGSSGECGKLKLGNLESKTELGSQAGDFGCLVLKSDDVEVETLETYDCINTDPSTTNDSFPRALVTTGNNNRVGEVLVKNVRCPYINTGDNNRIDVMRLGTFQDNGLYLFGNGARIGTLTVKDFADEPVVFGGSDHRIHEMALENGQLSNSIFGVQNASDCAVESIVARGEIKCTNIVKSRSGNTSSSLHLNGLTGKFLVSSEPISFRVGTCELLVSDSNITVLRDTGYDTNNITYGSSTVFTDTTITVENKAGFTSSHANTFFTGVDVDKCKNVSVVSKTNGYLRAIDFSNLDKSIVQWNNNWGHSYTTSSLSRPRREFFGGGKPTNGDWAEGDIIWHIAPTSTVIGWVCIVSGSPGTWRDF